MEKKFRVLLLGYYGFGNAGDELILASIQKELARMPLPIELTVITAGRGNAPAEKGFGVVSRRNWFLLMKEMLRCDVFVLGGGGLLQDKTSTASIAYYLGVLILVRLMNRRVLLWSVGVENLQSRWGRLLTRWALSGRVDIWVRDQESARILSSLNLKAPILVGADPCFLLWEENLKPPAAPTDILILIPRAGGVLSTVDFLGDFLLSAQQDLGLKPVVLMFHPQKDSPAAQRVSRAVPQEVPIISWETHEDLKKHLGEARCVVSERLHGLILSALAGTPFVGIGLEEKTGRFSQLAGAPWSRGPRDAQELLELVKVALVTKSDASNKFQALLPSIRQMARGPAQTLHGLLLTSPHHL